MKINLIEGRPEKVLIKFTLPLFISVVFQQLYSMADSFIVGNYAQNGEDAIAAVGASYPITMIFMAIAVGTNIGCSVVISHHYGAGDMRRVKSAASTALFSALAISLLLTALGFALSSPLLSVVKTPQEIFHDSAVYFNIYIGGFVFVFLYNVVTGIFTALGDSATPLYFLIGSSVANIVLDAVFVIAFAWDVAGVAWATFIAQAAACVLVLIALFARFGKLGDKGESYSRFSTSELSRISKYALPSILQQSFISLGNIFIQALINDEGKAAVAGYSAAVKANTFAITSFTTLCNGMSSFTAQNIGARKTKRISEGGYRGGILMAAVFSLVFTSLYLIFSESLIRLFIDNPSEQAIITGKNFLTTVAPFYIFVAVKLMTDGVLRGSGCMGQFMCATFTDLVLRVVISYILYPSLGSNGVWASWPVGWVVASVISLVFYFTGKWKKMGNAQKAVEQ